MFVQVMEGHAADAEGLRADIERWMAELRPGAEGFLGATAGVAGDRTFVSVVRFESEEAATANSERAEQGEWWEAFSSKVDGDVRFTNCPVVDTFGTGGSDDAGFVQVIKGRANRDELRPVAEETDAILRRRRPDVIGGIVAWPGDGSFVQVVYFTSEAEARAGESTEPATDEEREAWARMGTLMEVDRYIDLSDPWLHGA